MITSTMQLKVVLPHKIFLQQAEVKRIVIETRQGSLGLLPRRLDCVASLVPGILVYETNLVKENYLALDRGVMVKRGADVMVVVRRAILGADLQHLHTAVDMQFRQQNEQEKNVRLALARMESELVRRLVGLKVHD